MPHRAHLFSLQPGHALRDSLAEGYSWSRLSRDLMAGVTVGIIAIPLSMALAIASGVAPQYGLYTAIIGGILIAVTGGSRFSISGPTAAFVVILYPVAQRYGLAGLLTASMMAGALLVLMAVLRLGRLIEYIPAPVTLGFTAGIGTVIGTLQLQDFFGLTVPTLPASYWGKLIALLTALPSCDWASVLVAALTLAMLLLWPKLRTPIPPHLPAVLAGSLLALALNHHGLSVATIGSRFHYVLENGLAGQGIPPSLPHLEWPWQRTGGSGPVLHWSWGLLRQLLPTAFAIAMLGAIESLLCAVVLDGMTGRRHSANSELLGQGIGNLVVPFFGGITATAAIARSSANYKAGAQTPLSAVLHALVVLLSLVVLARWLGYLPMPAMAALLMLVAWNMSEAPKAWKLIRRAPLGDVLVFLTCFSLTVFVDMVVAITVGVLLASILFMRGVAEMTRVSDISDSPLVGRALPAGWGVFKINGALFFAAADRAFGELSRLAAGHTTMVLYMDAVPVMDAGGLAALERFLDLCERNGTRVLIADLQFQPLKTLARAGLGPRPGVVSYTPTLRAALDSAD